jgi:hypothetical protein
MSSAYLPLVLAVAGNVAYHLLQKTIRPDTPPAASLVACYLVALAAAACMLPFVDGPLVALRRAPWQSWALGAAAALIEVGFLLAYRNGWALGTAAAWANVAIVVLLVPLGVVVFAEPLGVRRLVGLGCAIVALILLAPRSTP